MPRRHRLDGPGTVHHVFNRGIAPRTMFETRSDKRMFLAFVAKAVRRGEIRVLSFCVLTTHYHLLIESVEGGLGGVMQRIQTGYSRYFNRSRRRDGPLVRGRFTSKRVRNDRYRMNVVAYINQNPVQAGLATRSTLYEFCGAHPSWAKKRWLAFEPDVRPGLDAPKGGAC